MHLWPFLCFLALAVNPANAAIKDSIPPPVGRVNDFEHLLTGKEKDSLNILIRDFEHKTTIQIAVVTIDTSMTSSENFDQYTLAMLKSWGVGVRGKNNGVLVGFSRGYHKIRIQNGYGITPILSDAETKKIIDEVFIPYFKKAKYYEGLKNGLHALMKKLE